MTSRLAPAYYGLYMRAPQRGALMLGKQIKGCCKLILKADDKQQKNFAPSDESLISPKWVQATRPRIEISQQQ